MYLKSNFEFEQTESLEVVTLPNNWSLSELSLAEYELEQGDLYIKLDGKVFKIANYDDNLTKLIKTTDGETISTEFISEFIVNKEIELVAVSTTNQSIGKVVEVEGIAYAIISGQKYQLKVGMDLYKGQNIQTLKDSRVEIKMNDQSTIKLAELGKLSLSDFTYDEGSSVGKSIFSIFKGLFAFSSGLIARDEPANVKIKTPIAEIGLRGTKLAMEVDPDGKSSVTLIDGRIIVSNNDGTVELNTPWQTAYVPSVNALDLKQENQDDFLSKYKSVFSSSTELKDFLDEEPETNIQSNSKINQIIQSELNFQQDLSDEIVIDDVQELLTSFTKEATVNNFDLLLNSFFDKQIIDYFIENNEITTLIRNEITKVIDKFLDTINRNLGVYGNSADAKIVENNGQEKDYFIIDLPKDKTATVHMSYNDHATLRADAKEIIHVYYDAEFVKSGGSYESFIPQHPSSQNGSKLDIDQVGTPTKLDVLNLHFIFDVDEIKPSIYPIQGSGEYAAILNLSGFLKDQDLTNINKITFTIELNGDLSNNPKLIFSFRDDESFLKKFNQDIVFREVINGRSSTEGILSKEDIAGNNLGTANTILDRDGGSEFQFLYQFV